MMKAKLIKIDKNGTKHFQGPCTCDRCGGRGYYAIAMCNMQPVLSPHDGGVCWDCGGSGQVVKTWKEYTPEYRAKLDAQNAKRAEKKRLETERRQKEEAEKKRLEWLASHGFSPEGMTFVLLGDTYSSKDAIKAAGGCYDASIGWHAGHPVEGFQAIEVSIDEIATLSAWGRYEITAARTDWDEKKRQALLELPGAAPAGHYGSVGEKVTLELELVRSSWYDAHGYWGSSTTYIHQMKDADGHIFIWKTSSTLDRLDGDSLVPISSGERFTLAGTIKSHDEYKGQPQTILTRCKLK